MRTITILLAAAVVALGLLQLRPEAVVAQATAGGEASRVATVDLQRVLNESDRFARMQEDQQARQQKLADEQQQKQGEVKASQNQLDALGPDTPAWEAKRREVLEMAAGVRAWEEISKQIESSEQARDFLSLYEAANAAVEAVAKERGVDVVLATADLPEMSTLVRADRNQISAILQNRKVLYAGDRADLTQAVLLRLNAQ